MKTAGSLLAFPLALLLCTAAYAAGPPLTLSIHESRSIPMFGATAAWPLDASIVDAAVHSGKVTIFARGAGRTSVVVVGLTGQSQFEVIVAARPGTAAAPAARPAAGTAEVRYSSATREVQNSVTITNEAKNRTTEVHLRTVHQTGTPTGDRARTSVPSAWIRVFRGGKELTLLDRDVDHSPLTLDGTPLRGIHYRDEHWRAHAGYTTYAAYRSFLIPVDRQLVAGVGYAIKTSPHATLTPSLFGYQGQGTVASLLYEISRAGTNDLDLTGELAYSNGLGAALQLAYDTPRDRVRADLRHRPKDFAVVSTTPRGFFGDASWSRDYRPGSTASLVASASKTSSSRVVAASADVDHRLTNRLSLTGGASWGAFDATRSLTVPVGFRFDTPRAGVAALYRYARSSTNGGGHGFRVSGRASLGTLYASAFVDRQQNAPTLDLIFSERPDLALALEELGITASSPGELARALREHASLVELGFIEGMTIDFAPMRTQFGLETAWRGVSASRQQIRARVLHSVVEGVSSRSATTIATLSWSRRLAASSDFFASVSYWRTERRGQAPTTQPFIELGIRQRFDGLPSLFNGSGTIAGVVFSDEDLDGRSDGAGVVAEVDLDGTRTVQTKADGSFTFKGVPNGIHRVAVRVPNQPEAYFTTPSRAEVETGEHVAFGIATTPARVLGAVASDAGAGIAGVRVRLARGSNQVVATTASDGSFALAAAPGEWELSIVTESVPAGHALTGTEARIVTLDRTQPIRKSFTLRALRSINGAGAEPNATIEVSAIGKPIETDSQGRFSIRDLPPGPLTLITGGATYTIAVPAEPTSLTIDLGGDRR